MLTAVNDHATLQSTISRLESDKAALLEACKNTLAWGEAYRDDQGGLHNPMDWHISDGLDEAIAQAEKSDKGEAPEIPDST